MQTLAVLLYCTITGFRKALYCEWTKRKCKKENNDTVLRIMRIDKYIQAEIAETMNSALSQGIQLTSSLRSDMDLDADLLAALVLWVEIAAEAIHAARG